MKNLIRFCLVVILTILLGYTLQAQNHFAKLEQNRNSQAKELIHTLNKTRDTLILKSDKIINSLYTLNHDDTRNIDFEIDSTNYKFPLNKLPKGKHVFVAVLEPKLIVFVVKIFNDAPNNQSEISRTSNLISVEPADEDILIVDY